jgi:hypothetical protein
LVLIGGYFLFATLEHEEEAAAEEVYCQACLFQGQDTDLYQGKLPNACYYTYHYIMHDLLLKFYKNLEKQNYF